MPPIKAIAGLFLPYAAEHRVAVAPHAKTPMVPEFATRLVAAGAWGATVANVRQASVMLHAGIRRLIIANEVGGLSGARHLARLCLGFEASELCVFADSIDAVSALDEAWREFGPPAPLPVLIEVG